MLWDKNNINLFLFYKFFSIPTLYIMSKLTADYLFNEASDHTTNYDIESVQWNYRDDNKSRNYQDSMVTFDFSDLANSTAYTSYNMWSIVLPWTILVEGTKLDDAENDFAVSLKSSILQLIDQVRIEVNDSQINNPSNYSNIPLNYNLVKMSEEELKLIGSMINFCPDNPHSIRRPAANSANAPANYEYNNALSAYKTIKPGSVITGVAGAAVGAPVATAGTQITGTIMNSVLDDVVYPAINNNFDSLRKGYGVHNQNEVNTGRIQRMLETSFNPARASVSSFYNVGSAQIQNMTHIADQGVYHGYSIIPLCLLHPFFKSCPPLRGAKLKLGIRLNVNLKYELTFDNATGTYTDVSITNYGNGSNTCPIMVSALNDGLVNGTTTAPGVANTKITVQLLCGNVTSTANAGGTSVNQNVGNVATGCRIRFPMIQLNPEFENKYLQNPVKKCAFEDFFVYPDAKDMTIDPASSVSNIMINNSISRLRGMLIVPQSIDVGNKPSYQSPFSSAPFTTAPYAIPDELQIQVNNRNLFNLPMKYTYETYLDHVQMTNIGKISELGIGSGLISKQDFEAGLGYCYIDLKNAKYDEEDKLGVPIAISLKNPSLRTVKYVVVLYQEYRYEVDVSKGSFIKVT